MIILVDCVWGEWSAWSDCECVEGKGLTQRNRTIVQEAQNNGTECNDIDGSQKTACEVKCTTTTTTTPTPSTSTSTSTTKATTPRPPYLYVNLIFIVDW